MKMQDHFPDLPGWLAILLAKLLPAGLGVAIVAAADKPATRREMALRFFVGLSFSGLFTEAAMDALRSFAWLAWVDPHRISHIVAVAGVLGAVGWSFVGGAVVWLKRFRADPAAAVAEARKDLTP